MGWIGCDLDHTLAEYKPGMAGTATVGKPIVPMVERIKQHIADGYKVKIMTARVSGRGHDDKEIDRNRKAIQAWCKKHIGQDLEVTCEKDYEMIFLYDDRAVAVEPGTGKLLSPEFPLKVRKN